MEEQFLRLLLRLLMMLKQSADWCRQSNVCAHGTQTLRAVHTHAPWKKVQVCTSEREKESEQALFCFCCCERVCAVVVKKRSTGVEVQESVCVCVV